MHILALAAGLAMGAAAVPLTPNPALTPGVADSAVTQANIASTICQDGYTAKVRNVSGATKRAVFKEYGINPKSGHFEVDHLIPLEVGGSNDIHNLWDQAYFTKPWNAHVKDKLEGVLHRGVCSGKIDLKTAQHDIATDWRAAYIKYVGPAPK